MSEEKVITAEELANQIANARIYLDMLIDGATDEDVAEEVVKDWSGKVDLETALVATEILADRFCDRIPPPED